MLDIEAIVEATVPAAAWLAGRGHVELAEEMRDEFLHEWGFTPEMWNEAVGTLIEYAERKGEPDTESFEAILIGGSG